MKMRIPLVWEVRARHRGFTLLEVLVTLVIVTLGLLGVVALQGRALNAETEAYQRAQATALLNDVVDRINANRAVAQCFTGTYGTGVTTPLTACSGISGTSAAAMAGADVARNAWNDLLLGAAEKSSANASVGGLLNARGCVTTEAAKTITVPNPLPPPAPATITVTIEQNFYIAVAWQGLSDTSVPAPPSPTTTALTSAVACGSGQYGASDAARRVIWTSVRVVALN